MQPVSLSSFISLCLLRMRLTLMKAGAANVLIATLVLLACAACLIALPYAKEHLRAQQQVLVQLQQARDVVPVPPAPAPRDVGAARLAKFYDKLGERNYAEQQLKVLFAIADKKGLKLRQADYKWVEEGAGRFITYRISLPVQGSYGAIQQFCEQVLLAIPFSSLDQLSFKRETVGNNIIDAQLNFTLYLSDQAPGTAAQPGKGSDE